MPSPPPGQLPRASAGTLVNEVLEILELIGTNR